MTELPSGTVTFFFSDIEGSTKLIQQCGDRWPALLGRHAELLRQALERHGGVEIGTEGDSFFAVFDGAPAALRAAVDAQRALSDEPWPDDVPVRVRIGLHTGEATVSGRDYVGLDVHRGARIMDAAHGGQILVSAATEALARGSVPDGVELADLGEHRLRDIEHAEHLFMVRGPGLPDSFPPPRSVAVGETKLPGEVTSFIGREEEVERVRALLAEHRIVTLTGPGGTGKTRLSIRVAQEVGEAYPGGVYFVALADIHEVELVLPTIGHAVGLVDPGRKPLERVAQHLAGRRVLLVLDNLEQVIEGGGDLAELLSAVGDLSILATSRSPLRIYGEVEFAVPPLDLPDPRAVPPDASIVRYPAVALFVERARAVRPDFTVTDENAGAVAEICWRLDGLPLALELAAARVRILTPQAMAARLESRLDVGAGGGRDRPERQQTLRGAISWSHELLEPAARRFFASLAVFRGGADLDAIEAIASEGGEDPLDAISALVDQSLLRQDELPDGSVRFGMLETIREYADEQLAAREDAAEVRRRHARYYLELVERLSGRVFDPDAKAVVDAIEREHDNIRAAIAWAVETREVEMALRYLPATWRFWQIRFHLPEGAERAGRILTLPGTDAHPELLVRAEEAAGGIFYWQGDYEHAREHYEHQLELQRQLGGEAEIANALYNLSMSFVIDMSGDERRVDPRAYALIDEALELYRRVGDRDGEGKVLWAAADAHIFDGKEDEARELGHQALEIFGEVGNRFMAAWTHHMMGVNENLAGNTEEALAHFSHALDHFAEADDVSGFALAFDGFATSAYRRGDSELAMRLAGAATAIQHAGESQLGRLNREWSDFETERLLADPALAAAFEAGAKMDRSEVVALARRMRTGERETG